MVKRVPIILLQLISAPFLCLAAYWSVRLAIADHLSRTNSLHNIQLATQLAPGNAPYLLRLAELEAGEDKDPSLPLQKAAKASPLNSAVWIQLGLQAEQKGDMAAAEQSLLQAAQLARLFRPRWELASFYVRRNDPQLVWRWAEEALQIAPPEDVAAVFRLCWNANPQADAIWREAIPKTPAVMERYLGFLLTENKLDAAAPVAAQLAEVAQASQTPWLLAYCDAAIAANRPGFQDAALSCWNRMSRRGLLPYPPLDPSAGKSLINGNFAHAPTGRGFDWRPANIEGVSVNYYQTNPNLWIEFSGKQPESCEPLSTWVLLEPLRNYRLTCRYEAAGIPPGSGLKWRLGTQFTSQTPATMEFRTPEGAQRLWRLALVYQRAPGTVRIEGSIRLASVSLEFAP
ncbi:MAG: hypothetical protein M3Y07_14385 [Acidobacteriota bacterium]|nr:hypothetical protein [Acidobacteriota bacterium]